MARKFPRKNRLDALTEINVTPLIDLAFALLIIFMITTPLLEQTIEVDLPIEAAKAQSRTRVPIIAIDAAGRCSGAMNRSPGSNSLTCWTPWRWILRRRFSVFARMRNATSGDYGDRYDSTTRTLESTGYRGRVTMKARIHPRQPVGAGQHRGRYNDGNDRSDAMAEGTTVGPQ